MVVTLLYYFSKLFILKGKYSMCSIPISTLKYFFPVIDFCLCNNHNGLHDITVVKNVLWYRCWIMTQNWTCFFHHILSSLYYLQHKWSILGGWKPFWGLHVIIVFTHVASVIFNYLCWINTDQKICHNNTDI